MITGEPKLSILQSASEGWRPHEMLPCLLHGMSQDALRDEAAQVSQVQCRLRRQWLPPTLAGMKCVSGKAIARIKASRWRSIELTPPVLPTHYRVLMDNPFDSCMWKDLWSLIMFWLNLVTRLRLIGIDVWVGYRGRRECYIKKE